ncbi:MULTISPECIES: hypothetical protein [Marichromatium]|uniref:Uncharacterized protein n=1 Tax=Marichromatium gracile TaxID=1048 RepID=A0A4R4ADF9_MARGR|nr:MULTISPECIES: hypothetical protein [Marichromatium]MBO8085714.1 hypothetical protein [Marichromatium sp.]MBK1709232.1 hypothetical protein [Marichromatium gracile]RNE90554.1 hypothetical protein EBL84_06425 [Marichromatium sp. AB31]RNE94043.1 hypothetical protein EBL85_04105 [Marichromatium sp. AB32]TCW37128.1 hypothetical protein EDC29_103326 [Marichromatium gracile]
MSSPATALPPDQLLDRLLALLERLYRDTADYRARCDEAQCWYDRGYADGMRAALAALGHGAALAARPLPEIEPLAPTERVTPWGRAHAHGVEVGGRETRDVLGGA